MGNIEIWLDIVSFIAIGYLAVLVYTKNRRSWTNRLFGILAIILNTYIVVNFISLHPPGRVEETQLFWIRIVMFVSSFIGPVLFLLSCTFPKEKISISRKIALPLIAITMLSAIASLSPFVFQSLDFNSGEPVPQPGPGIVLFVINFLGLVISSIVVLFNKYRKVPSQEKVKHFYFLLGVAISFIFMAVLTFVLVLVFKTSAGVIAGPIVPLILVGLLFYAINKHNLFDVRIITTELFTLFMWITFSFNIFTSNSLSQYIANIMLLALLIVFGLLLIRGTVREMEELRRLSRAKSEFVSIASHQLRTPLTAIKGFLSLILEGSGDEKLRRDWVDKAYQSNERLIRLVSDLLNISRIERGAIKYDLKKVSAVSIIKSLVEELQITAENNGIRLEMEKPKGNVPDINLDEEKIRQVLMNLIDNAINYTKEGSVTVKIIYLEDLNRIRILVRDTGVGMTKGDLENMFNIFSRGENVKKTHIEGMGLGLYVAHQIIQGHRGKIWATSEGLHKGSTFYIELPVE